MKTSSIKSESAYHAGKCSGQKARIIGGASDAKATGQRIRLMNLADMATVATKKNPGARPGFEFIARGNYPAGGRYPASKV
jgi:hypothetical protein